MQNPNLKYRTFEDLLADVQMDFMGYDLSGKIEPAQLIKVAMRVNYDLGLRIQQTKEQILEIEKGKVRLPDDFGDSGVVNYALICGSHTITHIPPQGTHIESINPVVPKYTAMGQPEVCGCPNNQKVCLEWNKEQPCIIQKINTETRTYHSLYQIRFVNSKFVNCDCPNLKYLCKDEAYIKDNFIHTNFDCANLYLNYEGTLVDDDGNLLVPNHPQISEYYEYAIKERILENLIMSGENLGPQIQMIQQKLRAARNYALAIVNTPNFSEMLAVWTMNRKAQYGKYYQPFESHPFSSREMSIASINRAV